MDAFPHYLWSLSIFIIKLIILFHRGKSDLNTWVDIFYEEKHFLNSYPIDMWSIDWWPQGGHRTSSATNLRALGVLHILGCYWISCRPTELTLRTSAERNTVAHWSWRGFYSNTILSPAPKVPNLKVLPSQERTDLHFAGADFKVHVLSLPVRTYLQLGLQVKCDYIFHSVQSVQTA